MLPSGVDLHYEGYVIHGSKCGEPCQTKPPRLHQRSLSPSAACALGWQQLILGQPPFFVLPRSTSSGQDSNHPDHATWGEWGRMNDQGASAIVLTRGKVPTMLLRFCCEMLPPGAVPVPPDPTPLPPADGCDGAGGRAMLPEVGPLPALVGTGVPGPPG